MMKVGQIVTVQVRNPQWSQRSKYAFPMEEFNTYTGEVVPSPRWVGPDQICIGTGNVSFPFRVIDLDRIHGQTSEIAPAEESLRSSWTVAGSKAGQTYLVTRQGLQWSCNCLGFGYRRSCTHINQAKSLILEENPKLLKTKDFPENAKSLILNQKKKLKKKQKSEKNALQISKSGLECKSKVMKRGNLAPYMMRSKMAKVEKHGDKTKIAIEVMEANVGKSYDEVCTLISKAIGVPLARARVYYRHKVINGLAKGYSPDVRPWETKAPKVPKAVKATAKRMAKEVFAAIKSPAEVSATKAKNLATLKAVSKKYNQVARKEGAGVANFDADEARAEVAAMYEELDSFKSPSKLTRDELKALV
jgi:hypothetical protein